MTYTRPDIWLGRWRTVDPVEAFATVVRRYLGAYGPATKPEIARWWGDSVGSLKPALDRLDEELVEIEAGDARGLFLRSELDAVADQRPAAGPLLLGPFDPLTVGLGRRGWFLPPDHTERVSRTAGWISPVVLVDGRAAGIWTSHRAGGQLELTIELFDRPTAAFRRGLGPAAERVAMAHGAELSLRFGPAFAPASEG